VGTSEGARPGGTSKSLTGSCTVWWAQARTDRRLERLLDHNEQGRLRRLRRAADRDRFVTGCAVLRLALHDLTGVPPERVPVIRTCIDCGRPHGRPRTPAGLGPWQLSVTHSGERVGVAIATRTPVGLDVEAIPPTRVAEELVDMLMTERERHLLEEVPDALRSEAVIRCWTRKEAVLKATGSGLRTSLSAFSVTSSLEAPAVEAWAGPGCGPEFWLSDLDPAPGYVASLAALGHVDTVEERSADVLLS
jgi:4'-phosphopantetheinyl transferase